ncbi:phosphonate C-P lyase system protein PhnH, partial [Yoonia sp.]|uniref:phosphonate C-P lyase system protein PhnH n=1 Tax=Yoonia sp. TaxID=2212373 RepID=UPI003A4E3D74
STTLIVEMAALTQTGARLTGPGIETTAALSLPESTTFQRNAALYPLGLDFLFTSGDHLAALPRTTRVEGH